MKILPVILAAAVSVTACSESEEPATTPETTETPTVSAPAPQVTVMAFNVQNLFDNVDAPGKDDKAYLPLADKQAEAHIAECNDIDVDSWRDECLNLDWSDAALEHKLDTVAAAILQVGDGRGPDVIALQEVENVDILERLRNEYLGDADYLPAILLEGNDVRGIDVAFLSRLPVSDVVLHPLELPEEFAGREGDTRGLLQATFELPDGSKLTGFSVHLPAPFHPTQMRVIAYSHLNGMLAAIPDDHNVFAGGDFNTTSTEEAEQGLMERLVRPHWATVSNDVCTGCTGTHYYGSGDSWSFLDMVLFSPSSNEASAWQVSSVEIANDLPAQVTADGTPNRYRSAERTGVSDHWPVLVTLEKRP